MTSRAYRWLAYRGRVGWWVWWAVEPDPDTESADRERSFVRNREQPLITGQIEARYLYAEADFDPYRLRDWRLAALPVESTAEGGLRVVSKEQLTAIGDDGMAAWLAEGEARYAKVLQRWIDEGWGEQAMREFWGPFLDEAALLRQRPRSSRVVAEFGEDPYACAAVVPGGISEAAGLPVQGVVVDGSEVIDCESDEEAHYLCALLNSHYMNEVAQQYPWEWGHVELGPLEVVRIPTFDPTDWRHLELAGLSAALHERSAEVEGNEPLWQYFRALGPDLKAANELAWDVLEEANWTSFTPSRR